jgi:hypothetical protein
MTGSPIPRRGLSGQDIGDREALQPSSPGAKEKATLISERGRMAIGVSPEIPSQN